MDDIRCKVLESIKNDNFLEVVHQSYLHDRNEMDTQLGKLLSELHNSGEVDIVLEFSKLNRTNHKQDFFSLRHIFIKALPFLEAPVLQVMECVKHLTNQAEGDMTKGIVIGPFIEYCKKTPSRVDEVLSISLNNIDDSFDFVTPSLIAGSQINIDQYFEIALGLLADNKNSEIIKRTIFSLGRIKYTNTQQTTRAFDAIREKSLESSEIDLSCCLNSLFHIYTQNLFLDTQIIEFIESIKSNNDDTLIHTASELLYFNDVIISESVEALLLDLASKVKPENKGTIDNLDFALMRMVERGQEEKAVLAFEKICDNSKSAISIQKFDSFARKLIENPNQILSKTITKWFLSEKVSLCKQSLALLSDKYSHNGTEIMCDLSQVDIDRPFVYLYLARKAIGWFFMRPISAISFVISMLDTCPDDQLQQIFEIAFHPLLISYPGSVKKYLEDKVVSSSDRVKSFCKDLFLKLDNYHDGMMTTSKLKELRPSEPDRYAYNRHHQLLMNESMKDARKSSLISVLGIHESVLLYGNKSISYIYTGNGNEKVRQEIPLHQISTSIEFPSLHILDPHRLDWMLRRFKVEGCK